MEISKRDLSFIWLLIVSSSKMTILCSFPVSISYPKLVLDYLKQDLVFTVLWEGIGFSAMSIFVIFRVISKQCGSWSRIRRMNTLLVQAISLAQ